MADTELVVLNNNTAIAEVTENENGNWGDDEEASLPQYIQMKQALTEGMDHVANGTFYHRASGQTWTEINMIILAMSKTRQWKPSAPLFVADEKPLCKSRNGKTPVTTDDRLVPQSADCASCKKASWAGYDKVARTGPKPVCDKGFNFLFLDAETNLPYIYDASGQSVDPSVALYEAIRARAKVVKAKTGRMPNTWEFQATMVSEKGNKAHKVKFTTVKQLTPEAAAKFGPLYTAFVTSRNKAESAPSSEVVEGEYETPDDTGQVDEVTEA